MTLAPVKLVCLLRLYRAVEHAGRRPPRRPPPWAWSASPEGGAAGSCAALRGRERGVEGFGVAAGEAAARPRCWQPRRPAELRGRPSALKRRHLRSRGRFNSFVVLPPSLACLWASFPVKSSRAASCIPSKPLATHSKRPRLLPLRTPPRPPLPAPGPPRCGGGVLGPNSGSGSVLWLWTYDCKGLRFGSST